MKNDETLLQQKLKSKMAKLGLSVHALEKQAGLKRSAVQNIIHGRSKNPSAQILQAIAKILGCNINDLISNSEVSYSITPQNGTSSHSGLTNDEKPFDIALYAEAASVAKDIFSELSITPSFNQSIHYLKEIYQYSIETRLQHIDKSFSSWFAKKYFSKQ